MSGDSFVDLGWDPAKFIERLDSVYTIENRMDGRRYSYGHLFRKSPIIRDYARLVITRIIRGGRVMITTSKSRQQGFTTFISCLGYDILSTVPGMQAGIVSHTDEGVRMCHDKWWGYYRNSPVHSRPPLAGNNDEEIRFGDDTTAGIRAGAVSHDSLARFKTARGRHPLSGMSSLRFVHLNETGKVELTPRRADDMIASVLDAMPSSGPSLLLSESTAKGVDPNIHHKITKRAMDNVANGREALPGEWEPFFAPAHVDPSNRMDVEPKFRWDDWPTHDLPREAALREQLGATDEFLRWRRNKIQQHLNWNFALFMEEYPCFPDDPFQATSASLIPRHVIDRARRHLATPHAYDYALEDSDAPFGIEAITGW